MILIKKFFAFALTLILVGIQTAFAETFEAPLGYEYPQVLHSKTLLHANNVLPLTFVEDFNANKSEEGMIIKFRLDKQFTDVDGDILPANTIFYGKVDSLTKSRFGFRKASAKISINKMILPDGRVININNNSAEETLSSSTAANVAKGIVTSAAAAGVGMVGAIVIAVECLSVGGVLLAPYTGGAVGIALGATSKGVNFKVPAGTKINIIFKKPIDIFED